MLALTCPSRHQGLCAFTLVETLIVVLILAVLSALLLASLRDSRRTVHAGQCLSNLRQIHLGMRQYALQHQQTLPDPKAPGVSWAAMIEPYLSGTEVLRCPADQEVATLTGVSYDWRDTGDPLTTLAGRMIDPRIRNDAVLAFETLPGWHSRGRINVVRLDGSALIVDESICFKDLLTPIRPANE